VTTPSTAIFALPGTLSLGGREFAVAAPTPTDVARTHQEMRRLAAQECLSPLAYVSASAPSLDPATHAEAVRAAVAMGSGGGVEPTRESVFRTYESLAGVRWRVWYAVRKLDGTFTQEQAAKLVTEENVFEVADALSKALGLDSLEKKVPPSGEK
jgi:hypothetical protein